MLCLPRTSETLLTSWPCFKVAISKLFSEPFCGLGANAGLTKSVGSTLLPKSPNLFPQREQIAPENLHGKRSKPNRPMMRPRVRHARAARWKRHFPAICSCA